MADCHIQGTFIHGYGYVISLLHSGMRKKLCFSERSRAILSMISFETTSLRICCRSLYYIISCDTTIAVRGRDIKFIEIMLSSSIRKMDVYKSIIDGV